MAPADGGTRRGWRSSRPTWRPCGPGSPTACRGCRPRSGRGPADRGHQDVPRSRHHALASLGVVDVGENKDQEAAPKAAACAAAGLDLRWHFVGQLQVNKAASVASYAYMVHSVDRARLVAALGRRASDGRPGDPVPGAGQSRPGDRPARPAAARRSVAAQPPARCWISPGRSRRAKGSNSPGSWPSRRSGCRPGPPMPGCGRSPRRCGPSIPDARVISAGMSGDLEDAIAEGATHVRIGTALLGGRRPFVR